MTDKVTRKLEGNDVRIMLDSVSSVSLDKGSLPKQSTLSGKMPQLQTADWHRLAVMGTVQTQLQFQHFRVGLFHGTERNAGLKHGTHGTKHYKYHVTAHASHVFILVCVWSTPWL